MCGVQHAEYTQRYIRYCPPISDHITPTRLTPDRAPYTTRTPPRAPIARVRMRAPGTRLHPPAYTCDQGHSTRAAQGPPASSPILLSPPPARKQGG